MPFGRPPPSMEPLDQIFRPLPGQNPSAMGHQGCFNAGVVVVERCQDRKRCIEKRLKPEEVAKGKAGFEISVLRDLEHPNVCQYIDAFLDENQSNPRASLYMEYCELGTLDDVLERYFHMNRRVPEGAVWSIFKQLTNALGYCQYGIQDATRGREGPHPGWVGVVHRDLKPNNVFLSSRSNGPFPRVVLGDFGCAIRDDDNSFEGLEYHNIDLYWDPPETPAFGYYTDIWGLGAVIQAVCRLDGPPGSRYGPLGGGRRLLGAGTYYSPPLNQALGIIMNTDPDHRLALDIFGPRLRMLWDQAGRPPPTLSSWAFSSRN
ncbi:hypothetical protein MMC08_003349 [Hypocenomyce scalaris]|nr:hypothetical protein [Hypocenomyce scalaris]